MLGDQLIRFWVFKVRPHYAEWELCHFTSKELTLVLEIDCWY